MLRKILGRCPLLLLVVALVIVRGDKEEEGECKNGYLKFKGKCVKRFVPPTRKECPVPEGGIKNGEFVIKGQGRMANFFCNDGWMRVPDNTYAMCKLGVWSRTVPNCVKPGCPDLSSSLSSSVTHRVEYGGAIIKFACSKSALVMLGQPVLGCDGERWNGTAPTCREPPSTTTTTTTASPNKINEKMVSDGGAVAKGGRMDMNVLLLLLTLMALTRYRCNVA